MISKQIVEIANFIDINRQILFLKNSKFYRILKGQIIELPRKKTDHKNVFKVWARQCECVLAHRVRRGQQMFCLYAKWWEDRALKEFIRNIRLDFMKKGRNFLLGAIGVSYNWDNHRIPDEEFKKHYDDLDYAVILRQNTVPCKDCDENSNQSVVSASYDNWVLFIQQDDMITWRREVTKSSGLYEYKVYASYHDISAEDFLNVQVDVDYRREWDNTAVVLEVGEREYESNSDILYWEMLWPRFFSNRDYVFNRRYTIDEESKTIVIVNKITEHPLYPKYPQKYRVEEYWSVMVIKPYTDLRNPGIEFSLTYFDNPGVNVPTSIQSWVSMKAMPDYLVKLRSATRTYKEYCVRQGVSKACERIKEEEKQRRAKEKREQLDYCSLENKENEPNIDVKPLNHSKEPEPNVVVKHDHDDDILSEIGIIVNTKGTSNSENVKNVKSKLNVQDVKSELNVKDIKSELRDQSDLPENKKNNNSGKNYEKIQESNQSNVQKESSKSSFLKYLHPMYYFS